MKTVAIIPARKGSKRIKNKNRINFFGKMLVEWSIEFALKLGFIDDIIISTDDKPLIRKLKKYKFIKIFNRPKYLSKDDTETIDVIFYVLEQYEKKFNKVKAVVLLQATSPFRSIKKIKLAYKEFLNAKSERSVISVSKRVKEMKPNGNFYIASKNFLKKYKTFNKIKKTIHCILNSKILSVDIDTKKDIKIAKDLFKKMRQKKVIYA